MNCRHCQASLHHVFLDLGFAPPSNAYLTDADLCRPELYYPLKLYVCDHCWLVQTADYARADELFRADYAYFSSTSSTWLAHAARYTDMIRARLNLGAASRVIEVAANDGYLLRNFLKAGIPCLGIDPLPTPPPRPSRKAFRCCGNSSVPRWVGSWPGRAARPISSSATTPTPMCRTSTISPPVSSSPAAALITASPEGGQALVQSTESPAALFRNDPTDPGLHVHL